MERDLAEKLKEVYGIKKGKRPGPKPRLTLNGPATPATPCQIQKILEKQEELNKANSPKP